MCITGSGRASLVETLERGRRENGGGDAGYGLVAHHVAFYHVMSVHNVGGRRRRRLRALGHSPMGNGNDRGLLGRGHKIHATVS